jgi:hypothetical protein
LCQDGEYSGKRRTYKDSNLLQWPLLPQAETPIVSVADQAQNCHWSRPWVPGFCFWSWPYIYLESYACWCMLTYRVLVCSTTAFFEIRLLCELLL